jgi:hypothetical protein
VALLPVASVVVDVLVVTKVCVWLTWAVSVNVFRKVEVMLEIKVMVVSVDSVLFEGPVGSVNRIDAAPIAIIDVTPTTITVNTADTPLRGFKASDSSDYAQKVGGHEAGRKSVLAYSPYRSALPSFQK